MWLDPDQPEREACGWLLILLLIVVAMALIGLVSAIAPLV